MFHIFLSEVLKEQQSKVPNQTSVYLQSQYTNLTSNVVIELQIAKDKQIIS